MIAVRSATPEDARAIADLNVRAWQAAYREAVADEVLEAQEPGHRAEYFAEHLPSTPPFFTDVAADGDTVIGFVHIGPNRDADLAELPEIYGLYVDPGRHRRGVGRLLMHRALERMHPDLDRGATLWTLRDVPATRRFYESMGWSPDGAVKTEWIADHPLPQVRYRFDQDRTARSPSDH